MRLTVTEAKAQLTDVVKHAEAGEDNVLRHHRPEVARIVGMRKRPSALPCREVIETVRRQAARKARQGPPAVQSQDFLYKGDVLPG